MDSMDVCPFSEPSPRSGIREQDGRAILPLSCHHGQAGLIPLPPVWLNPSEGGEGPTIEQLLRREMVHLPQQGTKFLPVDKLYEIVCPDAVRRELQSRLHLPEPGLSRVVSEVCGGETDGAGQRHPQDRKCRRRLFAILTLIDQVHQILPIIWENLWDSALPFTTSASQSTSQGTVTSIIKTRDNDEVRCLQVWTDFAREAFDVYQWTVLSPSFHFPGTYEGEAPHYDLPDRAVVPFISTFSTSQGGFSTVYKTVIHPAHYSIGGVSQSVSVRIAYLLKLLQLRGPSRVSFG